MPTAKVEEKAQRLVEELPDDATWDDLMQRIYVRQAIEAGIEDSEAGYTMDVNELRQKLGLSARGVTGQTRPSIISCRSTNYVSHDSDVYADRLMDRLTRRSQQIGTFPHRLPTAVGIRLG
jgi:predicted DNA-binding protein